MSILDRRPPEIFRADRRQRMNCDYCWFFSYDPEQAIAHMHGVHANRRVMAVSPRPARRFEDQHSPWVVLARAGKLPPGGALPTNRRHN